MLHATSRAHSQAAHHVLGRASSTAAHRVAPTRQLSSSARRHSDGEHTRPHTLKMCLDLTRHVLTRPIFSQIGPMTRTCPIVVWAGKTRAQLRPPPRRAHKLTRHTTRHTRTNHSHSSQDPQRSLLLLRRPRDLYVLVCSRSPSRARLPSFFAELVRAHKLTPTIAFALGSALAVVFISSADCERRCGSEQSEAAAQEAADVGAQLL